MYLIQQFIIFLQYVKVKLVHSGVCRGENDSFA